MEQRPREEEYLCRDPHAVVLKHVRNNTRDESVGSNIYTEYFLSGEQPP